MNVLRQKDLRFLTILFLLAFIIKAAVPEGFMPGETADGKMEIVICTGHGPATEIVDITQTPVSHDRNSRKEDNAHPACPYAPVVVQGLDDVMPSFLPLGQFNYSRKIIPADLPSADIARKPWYAQGPPAVS